MDKQGTVSRSYCVGICEICLRLISDTAHGGHRHQCPRCGEMVHMTPAEDLVPGLQVVADIVEQILPESIFHNRSICPWPVLFRGRWYIDVRVPPGGEYGELACKYFPSAYKDFVNRFMEKEIPDEAVMGDWMEESLMIAPEDIGLKELFRFTRHLNTWRKNWNSRTDVRWKQIITSWVSELSQAETERMRRQVCGQKLPPENGLGGGCAVTWLKQRLKTHRDFLIGALHGS